MVDVAQGLTFTISVTVLYLLTALLTVYLQRSGLPEQFILPLFTQLGLTKTLVPWAAVFVTFLISWAAGTLGNIFIAFEGKYDNNHPRPFKNTLTEGFTARIYAAHLNSLENLAFFGVTLIIAHIAKVPLTIRISYALIHVAARFIYPFAYLLNIDLLRSISHLTAQWAVIILFLFVLLTNARSDIDGVYDLFAEPISQAFAPVIAQITTLLK